MFKCGFSAAGLQQQKRSLLPGAERPEREHAWNKVKRATSIQATQEPKTAMFRTKLQPYSNHTSSNRPLARPMDNQSKSSKKLKLSSAMTGQVKANDAGRRGTRARPANARPECSTSAINKPKFGRGKTCRGFRRDKTFPSHENRSWRGKMHTSGIRKGRSLKTTKKKRASLVQQHPLAKSFTDSLDHTTAHLSETLPQTLSDKLETLLCRTAATTSLSETYLTYSSRLKDTLFSSSPLLSGSLEKKADKLNDLTHEGLEKLDVLWEKWKQCVDEIQQLATDEAIFVDGREARNYGNGKDDGNRSDMVNDGEDWGELEYAAVVERIKSVGEVWTEKMEECEKKIADEELRQQRLAATVLL